MVTVVPPLARELLGDRAIQEKKIGKEFAAMRGDHMHALSPVEKVIRQAAPLTASYDVNRNQPPYFHEFTYTEMLGTGLLVSPMSVEVSARLVQRALDRPEQGFDAAAAVLEQRQKRGTLDKYKLNPNGQPTAKAVAFIPGSNIFKDIVSFEALSRAMWEDPELVIKPHPLSDVGLINHLSHTFGFHRVIDPFVSGDACLMAAERVYACTATEMGLYAVLMGLPIRNIGNVWNEGRAAYSAFYRVLWNKTPDEAKAVLTHVLNSPFSGFMHKDDPDVAERVSTYFAAAMDIREACKPMFPTPPPGPLPAPPEEPPPGPPPRPMLNVGLSVPPKRL